MTIRTPRPAHMGHAFTRARSKPSLMASATPRSRATGINGLPPPHPHHVQPASAHNQQADSDGRCQRER